MDQSASFILEWTNQRRLMQINETRGLGFDDWDLEFYEKLFKEKLGRDPTDVELFDMGQVGALLLYSRGGGSANHKRRL